MIKNLQIKCSLHVVWKLTSALLLISLVSVLSFQQVTTEDAYWFQGGLWGGGEGGLREREREREREKETSMWKRNINRLPPVWAPTGDWTWNPGMCPDQESNLWPFGSWGNAPSNWATVARALALPLFSLSFRAGCSSSLGGRSLT